MQALCSSVRPRGRVRGVALTLHYALVPLSLILFATGMCLVDFPLALAGVTCLFFSNVIYGFLSLRDRILFLFLHAGIALFLLSRPWAGVLDPERTWLLSSPETTAFALGALYLSMMCCFLGSVACEAVGNFNRSEQRRREKRAPLRVLSGAKGVRTASGASGLVDKISKSQRMRFIRTAALLCFLVCLAGAFAEGAIKLSYMQGMAYEDYYLIDSGEHVPWAVNFLRVMTPYMLCGYLATMPKRLPSTICLLLFVATSIPMLMIGSRSDFVIDVLFAALYYVFRAVTDTEERWITKKLVTFVCIAAPLGIVAMGLMDYVRAGNVNPIAGFLPMLEDALYKQGVSFTVLGHGYDVNPEIQSLGFKFYTMGDLISTVTQGFIGQTFLGCEKLPSTNSVELALGGSSYAHAMSYFAHSNYLGGEGYGSSYILELFADFGYGGIAVGSFLIAAALSLLSRSIGRSWFWGTVALISSMSVFHMARGYAIEWISFIWSTRFLAAVVLMVALSALFAYAACVGARQKRVDDACRLVVVSRGIVTADGAAAAGECDNAPDAHLNKRGIPLVSSCTRTIPTVR